MSKEIEAFNSWIAQHDQGILTQAGDESEMDVAERAWLACAEIKNKRIKELEAQNEKLIKCVEFYADIDSWHCLPTEPFKYLKIDPDDSGDGDFYKGEVDDRGVGGKVARKKLKEIKGE